jgi:asparagine synthase (glutamine-hydrolysing)
MRDTMAHRGPDDSGSVILSDGRVGLAHRRLSIVDLSAAGHQPMTNEDGTVWVTYNGEIYNHVDLRAGLESRGHRFKSRADTEVLVHLYEQTQAGLVQDLRGMFAFAVYDTRRDTLLLVRDRLGLKPLYYAETPAGLVFASEIKAILASGLVLPALDETRLPEYLNYGRVLPPNTLFRGITKLAPGHLLEYGPDRSARVSRYWDIFDGVDRSATEGLSERELVTRLSDSLQEAVSLRLMSDVPVGVFLSAGVDSSTIAAMVAAAKDVPLKTFTVGFEGTSVHNEVAQARSTAGLLGAEHHDITIGSAQVKSFFADYLDHMEEPGSNPTWMAVYFVSRLARDHGVIVALSGDGGDELFVGYDKWMKMLSTHKYAWSPFMHAPRAVRATMNRLVGPLLRGRVAGDLLRAAAAGEELYQGGTAFKRNEVTALVSADLVRGSHSGSPYEPIGRLRESFLQSAPDPGDYADWMTYASLKSGLLEDYLMRLDKMGMAASVEGRVPILDHEFVRLAMSVPGTIKYGGGQRKWLLKEVARGYLPAELVDLPKRGFNAPVAEWVSEGFSDMLCDSVSSFADRTGVLAPAGVIKLQQDVRTGRASAAGSWGIMSLALWHERWMS